MTRVRPRTRAWLLTFLIVTALIAASDAVLLEATRGGFGNGFGGVLLDTLAVRAEYLALTASLAAFALLLLWAVLVPLCRWAGQPPYRALTICALGGLGAIAWTDVLVYQIHTIVGALVTPGIVRELAGGNGASIDRAANLVSSFTDGSTVAWTVLAIGAGVTLGALTLSLHLANRWAANHAERAAALQAPRVRTLVLAAGLVAIGCAGFLAYPSPLTKRLTDAVALQPTAMLFRTLVNRVTDVDRDGSGLLSHPPDPAPFDAEIHGFALDRPANGIDEDLLTGDLPAGWPAPRPIEPPGEPPVRRPDVLVIYLESFRHDVLGLLSDGVPVTPFFDSLARDGASSDQMYVHSPFTARSRAQLFGGVLVPRPGQHTWIDDFRELGYQTAHFSGQDDSFGGTEAMLGRQPADVFYDARNDTALRISRSTAPASLQVSWKLLLQRVEGFLDSRDSDTPLFLFVNIVDTHYPYDHAELDRLIPGEPVDRSEIRSYNRERIWQTYLNAAANVDRAAGLLVRAFRSSIGDREHAILVTGDHGQSFYEDGTLGHGRRLDRHQTQVPLIVWGLGGRWPEPVGAADLRGLLLRSLSAPYAQRPDFAVAPDRRLFQYLPNLDRPDRIAWRTAADATLYDFELGSAVREDGSALDLRSEQVVSLIRAWEALRWQTAQTNDALDQQRAGRR